MFTREIWSGWATCSLTQSIITQDNCVYSSIANLWHVSDMRYALSSRCMHFRPQQPVDVFFSYKEYRAQAQAQLTLGGKDAVEMIEDPVDAPTTSPTNEHTKRYITSCVFPANSTCSIIVTISSFTLWSESHSRGSGWTVDHCNTCRHCIYTPITKDCVVWQLRMAKSQQSPFLNDSQPTVDHQRGTMSHPSMLTHSGPVICGLDCCWMIPTPQPPTP